MESSSQWFIAFTRPNQERKTAEKLRGMGVEAYVPVRKVRRQWSDRVKLMDEVLIHHLVFVHCTEARRMELLRNSGVVDKFMTDSATHHPAVVPDVQMDAFMKLCGEAGDSIRLESFAEGDSVEIVEGPLSGVRGILGKAGSGSTLSVKVENIGYATISIDACRVRRI